MTTWSSTHTPHQLLGTSLERWGKEPGATERAYRFATGNLVLSDGCLWVLMWSEPGWGWPRSPYSSSVVTAQSLLVLAQLYLSSTLSHTHQPPPPPEVLPLLIQKANQESNSFCLGLPSGFKMFEPFTPVLLPFFLQGALLSPPQTPVPNTKLLQELTQGDGVSKNCKKNRGDVRGWLGWVSP